MEYIRKLRGRRTLTTIHGALATTFGTESAVLVPHHDYEPLDSRVHNRTLIASSLPIPPCKGGDHAISQMPHLDNTPPVFAYAAFRWKRG